MPLGSSSLAPVISPGPSSWRKRSGCRGATSCSALRPAAGVPTADSSAGTSFRTSPVLGSGSTVSVLRMGSSLRRANLRLMFLRSLDDPRRALERTKAPRCELDRGLAAAPDRLRGPVEHPVDDVHGLGCPGPIEALQASDRSGEDGHLAPRGLAQARGIG